MECPREVSKIASEMAVKYPNDIEAATTEWMERVIELEGFEEWSASLVESAGRHMICDARHSIATRNKRASGFYGQPPKVSPGRDSLNVFRDSIYDHPIDGRRLGDIKFGELYGIAEEQEGKARGYRLNADICRLLYQRKPRGTTDDSTIQESMTENRIKKIFKEARGDRVVTAQKVNS